MAEVHRYKVLKMKSEDGGVLTYTPEGPEIVMASAYDALLAESNALRAQLPSQGGEAVSPAAYLTVNDSGQCQLSVGRLGENSRPLYTRPADQVAEPVLERPAKVGACTFADGLPQRMVVEAAYRQYEYAQDPPFSNEQIAAVAKALGADQVADAVGSADGDRPGYDALWLSFGMSRAAFVVLPRVMMHDMPDAWQADMARLLDEWEDTWVNQPNISSRVQIVDADGRLMKAPGWVLNYRHPDSEQLAAMKVPRTTS